MSFLLRALGSVGKSLWGGIKGAIFGRAAPVQQAITNFGSNLMSDAGQEKIMQMGNTAAHHMINRASGAIFDGVNKFANSDWVKRKMPIAVPGLQNAGQWLKNRLDDGYSAMGMGRDVEMRQPMAGLSNRYSANDGIER